MGPSWEETLFQEMLEKEPMIFSFLLKEISFKKIIQCPVIISKIHVKPVRFRLININLKK
jgi:hypothetical protein